MAGERGRLVWKIDGALWVCGVVGALAGMIHGLRSGRSPTDMLHGAWAYSVGVVLMLAAIGAVVLVLRWLAFREETDFLRKYPRRPR